MNDLLLPTTSSVLPVACANVFNLSEGGTTPIATNRVAAATVATSSPSAVQRQCRRSGASNRSSARRPLTSLNVVRIGDLDDRERCPRHRDV